jgi:hypothetical protein
MRPRFYTVLLGESADVKKSTALRRTAQFFESAPLKRFSNQHQV